MSITEIAIKRPSLIIVIFLVLGVLGLFSYFSLSYELLPKMSPPVVSVTTIYPGASPSEVENTVTKKIEDAVASLEKVTELKSTSSEGVSIVIIEFKQDANIDKSLQEAQRRVNAILADFPREVKAPTLGKFALDEMPIINMGASAEIESRAFYQLTKDQLMPRLTRLEGVGQVTIVGGERREIRVNIDADKLRTYGLSISQVSQAISTANVDFPTGSVKNTANQYTVRVAGKFASIEQLRDMVVASDRSTGGNIRLKDVAEVIDDKAESKQYNRINGKNALGLLIQKQNDANGVAVSKAVRDELGKLETQYKDINLKFDIVQDNSDFTIEAANHVKSDLMLAVFLVGAVMLLFLHSLRNSIIVMVAIPASLISTFIAMYVLGYTLNLMTLLGLSLVIGILVDDSIVVLENIYRYLEQGMDRREAALVGRNEIGFTAMAITLVDVVVFLPLAFVGGIVGNILEQFSIVVVVSTLLSLFVSFTITPMLASRFSRLEHPNPNKLGGRFVLGFERMFNSLRDGYADILNWSLNHKLIVGVVTTLMFFGAMSLPGLGFIGGEFIEQSDRGEFAITLELPTNATIEETNLVTQQIEKRLSDMPEVRKVRASVGISNDGFLAQSSNNLSEITVVLNKAKERTLSTDQLMVKLKQELSQIPGTKIRMAPIGFFGTADETPIQLIVTGPSYADVTRSAQQILDSAKTVRGTSDARLSIEASKPEIRVEMDREKMASLGINLAQVGGALRTALTGDDESKYRDGNNDYDIRVQLDAFDRSQIDKLAALTFLNQKGQLIELKQFAEVYQSTGPSRLQRYNRNPSVTVMSQVIGRPQGDVGNEIAAKTTQIDFPKGVTWTWDGNMKNNAESMGSMLSAMVIAILFMYFIMVALYDSFIYPFVVLFSIPVAIVGAMLALALAVKSITIFSMLGIIMMMGLVAKNAILLVDFTNHLKAKGYSLTEALIESGRERLRPILMTTLSMVFGMLPIALASGAGSEWKNGLAWALIGGLTSSMFLTLIVVPVAFYATDKTIDGVRGLFRRFGGGGKPQPIPAYTNGIGHDATVEPMKNAVS